MDPVKADPWIAEGKVNVPENGHCTLTSTNILEMVAECMLMNCRIFKCVETDCCWLTW